jgi:Skp family chaperone for outer membrane proteins
MKKHLILSATVLTITGAVLAAAPMVSAHGGFGGLESRTSLIQMLSSKFGLQESEVQSVFDQHRDEMQKEMQAKMEERLTQLVTDGKITDAQKQLIIAKHTELKTKHQAEMETLKDKTPEERRAVMEKRRTELEAWAKANTIDPQYVGMFGMRGQAKGMRGGMMTNASQSNQ